MYQTVKFLRNSGGYNKKTPQPSRVAALLPVLSHKKENNHQCGRCRQCWPQNLGVEETIIFACLGYCRLCCVFTMRCAAVGCRLVLIACCHGADDGKICCGCMLGGVEGCYSRCPYCVVQRVMPDRCLVCFRRGFGCCDCRLVACATDAQDKSYCKWHHPNNHYLV